MGKFQKLFYNFKNSINNEHENIDKEVFNSFHNFLENDLKIVTTTKISKDYMIEIVKNSCHYGTFVSYLCKFFPELKAEFKTEIIDGIRSFFNELTKLKKASCQVILNTGNWEDITPIDFDPSNYNVIIPERDTNCVSALISDICQEYDVTYNKEYIFIGNTIIIGITTSQKEYIKIDHICKKSYLPFASQLDW